MHSGHRYKSGQSVVLLALMMVVLIGMVGLSVDVGNAYAQQRRVQNGANAGALAGMNAVLEHQNNSKVWENVRRSLAGNNINPNGTEYTYTVEYVPKEGLPQPLATWNGSATSPVIIAGTPPSLTDLARVRVTLTERTDTYFASVVGRDTLTVTESGDACFGNYGMDVYPVGVPYKLKKYHDDNGKPYHRIYTKVGSFLVEVPTTDPRWGNWEAMDNLVVYLPIRGKADGLPGAHIGWLDWDGGSSSADELRDNFTSPGNLDEGFVEGPVFEGEGDSEDDDEDEEDEDVVGAENPQPGRLDLFDWINGGTGVKAGAEAGMEGLTDEVLLPMYDAAGKDGETSYRFYQMGRFKIIGYRFSASKSGGPVPPILPPRDLDNKYLLLQYIEDATGGTANGCS